MSSIIYKKLVEVRILHEYYLSGFDEVSFFDLSEADRMLRIHDLLGRSKYDIRKDIRITMTDSTARSLAQHRIRFITSPLGFFLGAEVTPVEVAGQPRFRMVLPPVDNPEWEFVIEAVNPQFGNFTNHILTMELSSGYFLTNSNPGGNKVYPSLSLPVEPFNLGLTYEMGALSIISGKVKQAQKQTASAASGWVELPQDNQWLNDSDRHLLPTRFRYQFVNPSVNQAVFALSDLDGNPVAEVDTADAGVQKVVDDAGFLKEAIADFTTFDNGSGDEITLEEGDFTLEVSENGSLVRTFNLHLYNELSRGFAGLLLKPKGTDPDFTFLEDDGLLIRRPDGSHPVFEIRIRNRITYWRYYSVTSKTLEAKNKATLFLDAPAAEKYLITKNPRSLQLEPVYFVDGGDKIFLPNPGNSHIIPETDGKLYSDIFMSEIKGLIENKT